MAAPATHILFALTIAKPSATEFIAGTSFPDIRYLGSISRERTHAFEINDITDSKTFISGMAFHEYIDEMRHDYWKKQAVYQNLPDTPLSDQALKFCEDVILYDTYNDWQSIVSAFTRPISIPMAFKDAVSNIEVSHWYSLIAKYLKENPDSHKIASLMKEIGFGEAHISTVSEVMERIIQDQNMVQAIRQYYQDMIKLIHTEVSHL